MAEEKYWNGDIPWVSSGEMTQRKIFSTKARVTEDGAREGSKRVPARTVLVVVRGMSLAKEFRVSITARDVTFNQDLKALLPSKELIPEFLFYYLLSQNHPIRDSASESAHGTKKLDTQVLEEWPIPLPSNSIQKKVAAILSAYDELIENNQRRIALLEKMAEEIYREWFVRLRFPGHEKVKVIKGLPQGWRLVKLKDAFKFTGGGTPTKEINRFWDGGEIDWYTPSDITSAGGIFLQRSREQCTEEGFNNSSAKLFPAYSVMLTSRATIGAVGINLTPACTNQGFITCVPNLQYPMSYLYQWIKLAKPHFELLSGGSTFAELTKGTFSRIEILTPPESIVTEFARIESPLFKAIENHLGANRMLIETRDLLLPRLISGKLSVENLDIQFPPSMKEPA